MSHCIPTNLNGYCISILCASILPPVHSSVALQLPDSNAPGICDNHEHSFWFQIQLQPCIQRNARQYFPIRTHSKIRIRGVRVSCMQQTASFPYIMFTVDEPRNFLPLNVSTHAYGNYLLRVCINLLG